MTTFADLPHGALSGLDAVRVAIIGASEASPYEADKPSHSANAPQALREASAKFAGQLRQYDFDLEASLFGPDGETFGMVDCGNIPTDRGDAAGNRQRITDATRRIVQSGAVPVILGGDDSVPSRGAAAVAIGVLLIALAGVILTESKSLLTGEAVSPVILTV
jgi:agmatinase